MGQDRRGVNSQEHKGGIRSEDQERNGVQGSGETIVINPKVFPTMLIVLDVLAAVHYVPAGDWRKVVYWLAAGVLSYVVTW